MNYSSETINKLYYGNRLINISVTNGGGGGDVPSNLSEWTFDDNGMVKSITYTAETIPASAYSYSKLTDVTIGNSVTSIGNDAFRECSSLTSVTIGNSVTSIGSAAFQRCSGLTSVTIPSGVTSIAYNVFYGCRSLTSVTVNATTPPTLANSNAFNNTNDCPIYVPSASVDVYKAAAKWSTHASRIQAIP